MLERFKKLFSILLCAAVVWATGEGAQAAAFLAPASFMTPFSILNFRRNEERMRLETQALSLLQVDSLNGGALLDGPPFINRLWNRYRIFVEEPLHPKLPSWITGFDLSAFTAIGLLLLAYQLGWIPPAGPVMMACGIVASIGKRTRKEQIDAIHNRFSLLARRGIQSAGLNMKYKVKVKIRAEDRVSGIPIDAEEVIVTRFRGHKQWFAKRENREENFFKGVQDVYEDVQREAEPEIPGETIQSVKSHSRFTTTGANGEETIDELAEAAQPHTMVPAEMLPQWVAGPDGSLQLTYNELADSFDFNGDLAKMVKMQFKLFGREMTNDELRAMLARVHYVDPSRIPSGDAPTLAGLSALFHTQGFWFASLKYARLIHVSQNPDADPPSKEQLKAWSNVFDRAFYVYRQFIHLDPGKSLDQISPAELQGFMDFMTDLLTGGQNEDQAKNAGDFITDFITRFGGDEAMREEFLAAVKELRETYDTYELKTLIRASVNAFVYNSLEYAVAHEIKPRFHGSIAGDFTSTIVSAGSVDQHVGLFVGEPGSFVVDEAGQNATIGSDRRMLQVDPLDRWRYDMNSGVGEVLVLGHDGEKITITIYSGPQNRVLSDAEILGRRKDIKDPQQVDPLAQRDPRFVEDKPMESEVRPLPAKLDEINQGIEKLTDKDFLKPAKELTRVMIRNRIYERIRKKIKINERDIPREIDLKILAGADDLSRQVWAKTLSEADLEKDTTEGAAEFTDRLIDMGFKPDEDQLEVLFQQLENLILRDTRPRLDRARDALKLLLKLFNPMMLWKSGKAYADRLEEATYDIITIGSEKSEYAGAQFGDDMELQWRFRQRSISANDWLVAATRFKNDPEGFRRHFRINFDRTVLLFTSESAETFDTELGGEWGARMVKEMFVMTGGKDNRLADLVGRDRTLYFHNPVSMVETHLAAYVAMNHAYTELLMFMGENISARFQGKLFFDSPWTLEHWSMIRRSVRHMLLEAVPEILGYRLDQEAMMEVDKNNLKPGEKEPAHQIINEQARYYGKAGKERSRVTKMRIAFLFLVVVLLREGPFTYVVLNFPRFLYFIGLQNAATWLAHGNEILLQHHGIHGLHFIDFLIYAALTGAITFTLRLVLKIIGRPTPTFLRRFSGLTLLIIDYYDYIWKFASLMGRKAFGVAYDINTPIIEGVKLTSASHERALTGDRRTSLWMGLSDGRYPVLKLLEESMKVLGRHAKSILTIPWLWMRRIPFFKMMNRPISPHVVMYGSSDVPSDELKSQKGWHRHLPLPNHETLPADAPEHVVLFYGSRIDAFKRLVTVGRLLTTLAQDVAGVDDRPNQKRSRLMNVWMKIVRWIDSYPWFEPGKTHPSTGSQTTPSPVPGDAIIEVLSSMPLTVERIMREKFVDPSPNAFRVVERVLLSWTPELEADLFHHELPPQPKRPATEWPMDHQLQMAS